MATNKGGAKGANNDAKPIPSKQNVADLEKKIKELEEENKGLKIQNEAFKQNFNVYATLWAEYKKLRSDKMKLRESLSKSKAYGLEVEKKYETMRTEYEKSYKLLWDKHEQHKTDLENAHRLSILIGDRLTHANIADLSDFYRPPKLPECFSEIYDNEWTDAFLELTEESSLSDDHAIRRLLDILMNAFRKCKEFTWDRYESLSLIASTFHVTDQNATSAVITDSQEARFRGKHLCSPNASTVDSTKDKKERETQTEERLESKTTPLNSTLTIDEKTSLKNIWRSSTVSLRHESLTLICAILSTKLRTPETHLPKTYKYLQVCCDVCWKMFMQEKPMYLEINAEEQIGQEKLFDTERFRAYKKAGRYVAYVVWPALFLHEGGPMLAKGIAQGCNKVPNT